VLFIYRVSALPLREHFRLSATTTFRAFGREKAIAEARPIPELPSVTRDYFALKTRIIIHLAD
jgi:hypothetical protein